LQKGLLRKATEILGGLVKAPACFLHKFRPLPADMARALRFRCFRQPASYPYGLAWMKCVSDTLAPDIRYMLVPDNDQVTLLDGYAN
jgi:hypothetical protein